MNTKISGRFSIWFIFKNLLPKPGFPLIFMLFLILIPLPLKTQDTLLLSMSLAVQRALANNYLVKNASLQIDKSSGNHLFEPPLEISYRFGHLYSVENGKLLEINQNFGAILTHIREMKKSSMHQTLVEQEYELTKAELIARVKSAYELWIYRYAVSGSLKDENDAYSKLIQIAEQRYESGDISLLEKTTLLAGAAQAEEQYFNSLDDIAISQHRLRLLIQDSSIYYPSSLEQQLYMINKESDTSFYYGNRYLDYYQQKYRLALIDQSIATSKNFPAINAGIFTQDINGFNHLYGAQIGIGVPLNISGYRNEVKNAKVNTATALHELEYQKNLNTSEIEILLLELNKYFRVIRRFETNSLPLSGLLINSALAQFDSEEIDYLLFLDNISAAFKIRKEYYQAILNYNQTAIQLEFYAD
jgi:cobalt-zinc-cadmium resistance protein CzcA